MNMYLVVLLERQIRHLTEIEKKQMLIIMSEGGQRGSQTSFESCNCS